MTDDERESPSIEEEVFKTLGHQIRRDILRVVGERKGVKFTEIKSATKIEESASLSYHLNALSPLLLHDEDIYKLSTLGKDAYSLLSKLVTYSETAEILVGVSRQLGSYIIANALLWASAILSIAVLEGPLEIMTFLVLASSFSVSNIIIFSIQQYTRTK